MTVFSSVSRTLPAGETDLTLTGAAEIDGAGNALDNRIVGNGAANVLRGLGGDDFLTGGGGADVLTGDAGADTLVGGFGNDTLRGGAGPDTFVFDAATLNAGSYDIVRDFSAGDSIRRIGLGADAFSFRQTAFGLEMTIALPSGGAAQVLFQGVDSAAALTGLGAIVGGAGADTLFGGAGDDVIRGGGGRDVILFGAGRDVAAGGVGSDTFVADGPAPSLATADVVTDFEYGDRVAVGALIGDRTFTSLESVLRVRTLGPGSAVLEIDVNPGAAAVWRPSVRFESAPDWMTAAGVNRALLLAQMVDVGRSSASATAGDPFGFSNENAVGCSFNDVALSADGRYVAYRATYVFSGPIAGDFIPPSLFEQAKREIELTGTRLDPASAADVAPGLIAGTEEALLSALALGSPAFLRVGEDLFAFDAGGAVQFDGVRAFLRAVRSPAGDDDLAIRFEYVPRSISPPFEVKSGLRVIDLQTTDVAAFDPPLNFTGTLLAEAEGKPFGAFVADYFALIGADDADLGPAAGLFRYDTAVTFEDGLFDVIVDAGAVGGSVALSDILPAADDPILVKSLSADGRFLAIERIDAGESGVNIESVIVDLATEAVRFSETTDTSTGGRLVITMAESGDAAVALRTGRVSTELQAIALDRGPVRDYADARGFAFRLEPPEPEAGRIALTSDIAAAAVGAPPDEDWFLLPEEFAEAGVTIAVERFGATGALADPALRIFHGEAATPVALRADAGLGRNERAVVGPYLDADGEARPVFVQVTGAGGGAGGYRLVVQRLEEPSAGRTTGAWAPPLARQLGALGEGEADWFRFEADRGERRSFTLSAPDAEDLAEAGLDGIGLDPLERGVLKVFDDRGRLAAMDLDGTLDFTARRAGEYFVEIRGRLFDPSGAYVLES